MALWLRGYHFDKFPPMHSIQIIFLLTIEDWNLQMIAPAIFDFLLLDYPLPAKKQKEEKKNTIYSEEIDSYFRGW